jgi:dolichol-phosphate mannosyltransferase
MGKRLWLTVPTYNESENLERLVAAVLPELERIAPGEHCLLVVDDHSPDGTGAIADRLAEEHEAVEVLHRAGKDGLGAAYLAGFRRALSGGAALVAVMDCDLSHDPRSLPELVAAAERGADLVIGSRYVKGGGIEDWPPLRRALSRAGSTYSRLLLGVKVRDLTGGFKCIRREVLEKVEPSSLRSQGYVFNIELTYRALLAGFVVEEVPITFRDRRYGKSKISFTIALEALALVPKLRRSAREVPEVQEALAVADTEPEPDAEPVTRSAV